MNRIIIPSIFVAVLLTAAIFAMMPVEKVSTVHTTLLAGMRSTDVFNFDGKILATGERIVFYDGLGNGKTAKLEVNWRFTTPGSLVIQFRDSLSGSWTTATSANTQNFDTNPATSPTGTPHFDKDTQGLRIEATAPVTFGDGDFFSVTIVGVP